MQTVRLGDLCRVLTVDAPEDVPDAILVGYVGQSTLAALSVGEPLRTNTEGSQILAVTPRSGTNPIWLGAILGSAWLASRLHAAGCHALDLQGLSDVRIPMVPQEKTQWLAQVQHTAQKMAHSLREQSRAALRQAAILEREANLRCIEQIVGLTVDEQEVETLPRPFVDGLQSAAPTRTPPTPNALHEAVQQMVDAGLVEQGSLILAQEAGAAAHAQLEQDLAAACFAAFTTTLPQLQLQTKGLPKGVKAAGWKKGNRLYLLEHQVRERCLAHLHPKVVRKLMDVPRIRHEIAPFTQHLIQALDKQGWLARTLNGMQGDPTFPLWNIQAGITKIKGVLVLDLPAHLVPPSQDSGYTVKVTGPLGPICRSVGTGE